MKRFLKWAGIAVSVPIILFVILCILIYIPPVQNFIVQKAASVASDATGMDIRLRRLSLSFPLDLVLHEATVTQDNDTLLDVNKLTIGIQLWPLVKKQVEVDGIKLEGASVNTLNLIEGMSMNGSIGELYITSHGVHLTPETAVVNEVGLKNTDIYISMADTTAADTTASAPLFWKIQLNNMDLENVSMALDMPLDSMQTSLSLRSASLRNGKVDLNKMAYGADHFSLQGAEAEYISGSSVLVPNEFNPSHVKVKNINIDIDSLYYEGNNIRADIKNFQMRERSGLEVISTRGHLVANDKEINVPKLRLNTSKSSVELEAKADWTVTTTADGAIRLRLAADIDKRDLFKFVPGMDEDIMKSIPEQPMEIRAGIDGNVSDLRLTALSVSMPEVMNIDVEGRLKHIMDTLRRDGTIALSADFPNMDFIKPLTGGIVIPKGTELEGDVNLKQNDIDALLAMKESAGSINLEGRYNMADDRYSAKLDIDKLDLIDFMPADSLYGLTTRFDLTGEGLDFFSPQTSLRADGRLEYLRYGSRELPKVGFEAHHRNGHSSFELKMKDETMDISALLTAFLKTDDIKADMNVDVRKLDLNAMGLIATPLMAKMKMKTKVQTDMNKTHKVSIKVDEINFKENSKWFKTKDLNAVAVVTNDSVKSFINSGDLALLFGTDDGFDRFSAALTNLSTAITRQLENRKFNHKELKGMLPNAKLRLMAGKDNPVSNILNSMDISFKKLDMKLETSPDKGLDGNGKLNRLRLGETMLDTIYFKTIQNEEKMAFVSGVKVNKTPRQEAFDLSLNGQMKTNQADVVLEYKNEQNETGTRLGLEAYMHEHGMSLKVAPFDPIIVYRTFKVNKDNYIYLSDEGKIHADLKMYDGKRSSLQFYSTPDSTVQQDLSIDIRGMDIGELRRVVPYMPDITGVVNMEGHYIQNDDMPNLSAELMADKITYEKNELGDWTLSAVYLPTEDKTHHADGFITRNGKNVFDLSGAYRPADEQNLLDKIVASVDMNEFPMEVVNAFIPDGMAKVSGSIDGNMDVTGSSSSPIIDGIVNLNDIDVYIPQISQTLKFENKPITVKNNNLTFDKINIYTGGKTPFTIDGTVDIMEMDVDMNMFAENFELINAKRTKQSIAYGKLIVNLDSSIKGTLDELKMRGDLRILGSSDFTYILQESPLTVEDRLNETVTFVNFNDTTENARRKLPELTLGGIDMLMDMHIDEGVQCMIDLNDASENYMKFEGGGDLAFQYNPDGSMVLNGRYTLLSGELKYAISLISKTFKIRPGSFIEWTGNVMNPNMNIQAMERVRAAVAQDESNTRNVNFDVGVSITNRLDDMGFTFTLEAPDDGTMQNELAAMSDSEKNKVAVTMLVTGMYMSDSGSGGSMNTNSALNSLLQSEINKLAGSAIKTVDINLGMESTEGEGGSTGTNYNFQLAKRFWNNRFRVVIGGKITTGNNASQQDDSFIDNISLEYRLDNSGTRYVKLFHEKNFESVLDGEVMETGAGILLRKKVSRLGELFIFRKKKDKKKKRESPSEEIKAVETKEQEI